MYIGFYPPYLYFPSIFFYIVTHSRRSLIVCFINDLTIIFNLLLTDLLTSSTFFTIHVWWHTIVDPGQEYLPDQIPSLLCIVP